MRKWGFLIICPIGKQICNEKRIAQAEALGHCPECNGKGFQIPIVNEYFYPESYECPSCNGTGAFPEWK